MTELERLIKEKTELERRIRLLTDGVIELDSVKLDTIKTSGGQCGKWAVSYKYQHVRWHGNEASNRPGEKWVPMFACENREETIKMIPKVITELNALYAKATKKEGDK